MPFIRSSTKNAVVDPVMPSRRSVRIVERETTPQPGTVLAAVKVSIRAERAEEKAGKTVKAGKVVKAGKAGKAGKLQIKKKGPPTSMVLNDSKEMDALHIRFGS